MSVISQDAARYTKKPQNSHLTILKLYMLSREFKVVYHYRKRRQHQQHKIRRKFWVMMTYLSSGNSYIDATADIGAGLLIVHLPVYIGQAKIGQHSSIHQNVTIGANDELHPPVLGNNVRVNANAGIYGAVNLGDNVIVGANAVVVKDVPSGWIVAGVPAKKIGDYDKKRFG